MHASDHTLQRLHNQQLSAPRLTTPSEVVAWMGAMQAQDYAGAKWALGQRLPNATDASTAIRDSCLSIGSIVTATVDTVELYKATNKGAYQ